MEKSALHYEDFLPIVDEILKIYPRSCILPEGKYVALTCGGSYTAMRFKQLYNELGFNAIENKEKVMKAIKEYVNKYKGTPWLMTALHNFIIKSYGGEVKSLLLEYIDDEGNESSFSWGDLA